MRLTDKHTGEVIRYGQLDYLYLVYFAVMLAHAKIPYLKFLLFLLIIFGTCWMLLKNGLSRPVRRQMLELAVWYGLFFGWVYLSQHWAYVDRPDSDIISTMVRIFPIALCIGYRARTRERVLVLLDALVTASTYFSFVFLITSPVNTWGTVLMGGITNQWRTFAGHWCALAAVLAFCLFRALRNRRHLLFALACGACSVLSGSRAGLISLGFMLVLLAFLEENLQRKTRQLLFVALLLLLVVFLLFNSNYLYEMYGSRLVALFSDSVVDTSADDRSMYRRVGIEMFLARPVQGWGLDNFAWYLAYVTGYSTEVYSHCNPIETLACYGLVGYILYYQIYFRKFCGLLRRRRRDWLENLCIAVLLRFFVFEFAVITFDVYLYIYLLAVIFCAANVTWRERCVAARLLQSRDGSSRARRHDAGRYVSGEQYTGSRCTEYRNSLTRLQAFRFPDSSADDSLRTRNSESDKSAYCYSDDKLMRDIMQRIVFPVRSGEHGGQSPDSPAEYGNALAILSDLQFPQYTGTEETVICRRASAEPDRPVPAYTMRQNRGRQLSGCPPAAPVDTEPVFSGTGGSLRKERPDLVSPPEAGVRALEFSDSPEEHL